MKHLSIYEAAAGCMTGACGPEQAQELIEFERCLELLVQRGVVIDRFNLGYDPDEFSSNAQVKAVIRQQGMNGLPMVFADGVMISQGVYPKAHQLQI